MASSDIVEAFRTKLETQWKRRAHCGRHFYLTDKIVDWMSRIEGANSRVGSSNIVLLLNKVLSKTGTFPAIQSDDVLSRDKSCALVLTILILLDQGPLVSSFRDHRVTDSQLPYPMPPNRRQSLISDLKDAGIANPEPLLRSFEEMKWQFCTRPLELRKDHDFTDGHWILPFCELEEITEGGTAVVSKAVIQAELIPPEFRAAVKNSMHTNKEQKECYQVAIKSYREHDKTSYNWELEAFRGVGEVDGVIQYLGHFSHDERQADGTFKRTRNIILEYGELDLMLFFADTQQHPPLMMPEIIKFWKLFLKVAEVIEQIHTLTVESEGEKTDQYHGWHADIKPENILWVDGVFKLADFGFSKFVKVNKDQVEGTEPQTNISGGTDEFGAPERYREIRQKTTTPLTQAIDIWSFGCVLSITATWVVLGYQGVQHFMGVRANALSTIFQDRGSLDSVSDGLTRFHDGNDVLEAVKHWHVFLREHLRTSDKVTGHVLLLVDQLLRGDPKKRMSAEQLKDKLTYIIEDEELSMSMGPLRVHPNIMDYLLNQNKDAPATAARAQQRPKQHSNPALQPSLAPRYQPGMHTKSVRKGRSEMLNVTVGQVASRTEALESVMSSIRPRKPPPPPLIKIPVPEEPEGIHPSPPGTNIKSRPPDFATKIGGTTVGQKDGGYGMGASNMESLNRTPPPVNGLGIRQETPQPRGLSRERSSLPSLGSPVHERGRADAHRNLSQHSRGTTPTTPVDNPHASFSSPAGPSSDAGGKLKNAENIPICVEHQRLVELYKKKKPWQKLPLDDELKQDIKDRDLVFVADNGWTMTVHWDRATYVMHTLAMKLQRLDDDGMDIYFTRSEHGKRTSKKHETFKDWMHEARPKKWSVPVDIAVTMSTIFSDYLREDDPRKMTVIVLTDGVWGGSSVTLEKNIVEFHQDLTRRFGNRHRWFTIQFISFGENPDGLLRLSNLDDKMEERYKIPDFIDTTPWDGPVDKMVLGSLNEGLDGDKQKTESSSRPQTGEEVVPSTPATQYHYGQLVMSPSTHSEFPPPAMRPTKVKRKSTLLDKLQDTFRGK